MKAQQTTIPMPIREIGGSRAATGPGTITTATPNNPALIAIGPATISRAGQLSVSDATESAAAVHASDAPANHVSSGQWTECVQSLQEQRRVYRKRTVGD